MNDFRLNLICLSPVVMGVCFNSLTFDIRSSMNSVTQSGFEVPRNKPMKNTLDLINEPRIGQSCNFDDLNNSKPSLSNLTDFQRYAIQHFYHTIPYT